MREGLNVHVGVDIAAIQPVERKRHGRKLGDELAWITGLDIEPCERRICQQLMKIVEQPLLLVAAEVFDIDAELGGDPQQQRAADITFVGFDQIEIAR